MIAKVQSGLATSESEGQRRMRALHTGGWPGHLLSVEVHLRPVLVELGATVPARGLYVTEPELADLDKAVTRWSEAAAPLIKRSVTQ